MERHRFLKQKLLKHNLEKVAFQSKLKAKAYVSASTAPGNVTYCKCYQAFQISWKLPSIMTRLKDQEHHSSQSHTNLFWMDPWNMLSRILKRQIPICTYRSANLYSFSGVNLTILMINRIRTVARMSKSKVLTSVYWFDDLNFISPA